MKKKKRILLKIKDFTVRSRSFKSLLNGVIEQDTDLRMEQADNLELITKKAPTDQGKKRTCSLRIVAPSILSQIRSYWRGVSNFSVLPAVRPPGSMRSARPLSKQELLVLAWKVP